MEFLNCTIRPGKVKEIVNKNGVIKATADGLFKEDTAADLLPPIYPIFNSSTFYNVEVGDIIWIIDNKSNDQLLFYIIINDPEKNKLIEEDYKQMCVLLCRDFGEEKTVQLYFSDGTGWMMRSEESFININKDGDIIIDSGKEERKIILNSDGVHIQTNNSLIDISKDNNIVIDTKKNNRAISINDDGIHLGSPNKSSKTAVYYEDLKAVLEDIYTQMNNININISSILTSASKLVPELTPLLQTYKVKEVSSTAQIEIGKQKIQTIKSKNVKLD